MKTNYKLFIGVFLLVLTIIVAARKMENTMNTKIASQATNALRVVFPFSLLHAKERLIDPSNLENISEYYLLENLGLGLLRDDPELAAAYKPGYAKAWKQLDEKTWSFKLVENAKWSDGSHISSEDWIAHFHSLKSNPSRHLIHLHNLSHALFEKESNSLVLSFLKSTTDTLLHELSLADAVLLNPRNLKGDWTVTSGAYSVSKVEWANKIIALTLNSNCPIANSESPKFAELFSLHKFEEIGSLFKTTRADLFPMPTPSFDPIYRTVEKNAFANIKGASTLISFFQFNKSNSLTKSLKIRKEFRTIVQQAFRGKKFGNANFEEQLIPDGYAGRLESLNLPATQITELRGRTLKISLFNGYKSLPEFTEILKAEALKYEVGLEFTYGNNNPEDSETFTSLYVFKGNQKEAIGSFSFLFSENGPLGLFRSSEEAELNRITSIVDSNERESAVRAFHKRAIENAYAVPVTIEPSQILVSQHVDLSRWNPFDMRLRIYDVRIK